MNPMDDTIETIDGIWKAYQAGLLGFIRRRVDSPAAAEDILQDVFVRVLTRIDTLADAGKIKGWLYRIARNAIIDHYRASGKTGPLPENIAAPQLDTSEQARRDIEGCVLPFIRNLPDKYREAVTLSEIEGLTHEQVAQRQGITLSGAKSRVQRGRAMIKDMLSECCRFEFDRRGSLVDYEAKDSERKRC